MILSAEEIIALTGKNFVTEYHNLKLRRYTGNPGVLKIYQDHLEYVVEEEPTPILNVPYETIHSVRVSQADKPKVQVQIVLTSNNEHINFIFADSTKTKDLLLQDQKKVLESMQSLIVRQRKLINKKEQEVAKQIVEEREIKKDLLKKSWLVKLLYTNLVMNNVMDSAEFWKMYFTRENHYTESTGVSNNFMFDIGVGTSSSSFTLNLTPDMVTQIFRIYPAVERKYHENVPRVMKEEEFWKMFFESHYFNRNRAEDNKNNLFVELIEEENTLMDKSSKETIQGIRPAKDLNKVGEDTGIYANNAADFNPPMSERKQLIRQFNNFSDRILATTLDPGSSSVFQGESYAMEVDGDGEEKDEDGLEKYTNEEQHDSDIEMDVDALESGSSSRVAQLRPVPNTAKYEEALSHIIDRVDEHDKEDNYELIIEDIEVANKACYPVTVQKPKSTGLKLASAQLKKLFDAYAVITELIRHVYKLLGQVTSLDGVKASQPIIAALGAFEAKQLTSLRAEFVAELGEEKGRRAVGFLFEAIERIRGDTTRAREKAIKNERLH